MNRKLISAALVTAGVLAAVPSAQAAGPNTCIYNPASKNVAVKLVSGGFVQLTREGNKIVTFDAFGQTVCASATGTVATIQQHGRDLHERLALGEGRLHRRPSAAATSRRARKTSSGNQDRAEVVIFNDASDIVDVSGSEAADIITVMGGFGTQANPGIRVNGNLNSAAPSVILQGGNPSLVARQRPRRRRPDHRQRRPSARRRRCTSSSRAATGNDNLVQRPDRRRQALRRGRRRLARHQAGPERRHQQRRCRQGHRVHGLPR